MVAGNQLSRWRTIAWMVIPNARIEHVNTLSSSKNIDAAALLDFGNRDRPLSPTFDR